MRVIDFQNGRPSRPYKVAVLVTLPGFLQAAANLHATPIEKRSQVREVDPSLLLSQPKQNHLE